MADCAEELASFGFRIFPLHHWTQNGCSCGKACRSPAKHPRISVWQDNATSNADTIGEWWKVFPNANIGLATGNDLLLSILTTHQG